MKKLDSRKMLLICLGVAGLTLSVPSIFYLITTKTVDGYSGQDYYFIGAEDRFSSILGTIMFGVIVILSFLAYWKILKKSNEFKNIKQIIVSVIFVSILFMICLPNTTTDIFYYMGTGRLLEKYNQNPYFITITDYLEANPDVQDEVLENAGYWSNTVPPYGPLFTTICALISKISFGSVTCFLYMYKLVTLLVHVACTYIVYKLTGRKKFALMYGLNPFLLIEFLVNCHNDIFIVFFMLLAFYFLKKEKNIWLALLCLASSILIKHVTLILAPFLALYAVKDKTKLKKIGWCFVYACFTLCIILAVYVSSYRGIAQLFEILGTQQGRIMNSIYIILCNYGLDEYNKTINLIATVLFICSFVAAMFLAFIGNKKISNYMVYIKNLLLLFIFTVLTNLTFWYLSWLFIPIFWLKPKNIRNILNLQFFAELSYVFLFWVHSDATIYQTKLLPFIFSGMIVRRLIIMIKEYKGEISCKKTKSIS